MIDRNELIDKASPELKAMVGLKLNINENLYRKGHIDKDMYEKMKAFLNSKEALKYDYITPKDEKR